MVPTTTTEIFWAQDYTCTQEANSKERESRHRKNRQRTDRELTENRQRIDKEGSRVQLAVFIVYGDRAGMIACLKDS